MLALAGLLLAASDVGAETHPLSGSGETFPGFEQDTAAPAVVLLRYTAGRYIEPFESCRAADAICLDPPPMALTARIERQLSGPAVPAKATMTVYTTSHYGLDNFDFDAPPRRLALLFTDGNTWVMGRYAQANVLADDAGRLAIPLAPRPIPWLPCAASQTRHEVTWSDPEQVKWPLDAAQEHPDFYVLRAAHAFVRYGLYVDELAGVLARGAQDAAAMRCHPEAADAAGTTE